MRFNATALFEPLLCRQTSEAPEFSNERSTSWNFHAPAPYRPSFGTVRAPKTVSATSAQPFVGTFHKGDLNQTANAPRQAFRTTLPANRSNASTPLNCGQQFYERISAA